MMNTPFFGDRFRRTQAKKPSNSSVGPSKERSTQELKQLSLAEFLQPLATAIRQKQPWVDDFGTDQIMVSPDLYEVIQTFAVMQSKRPASE